MSDDVVRRYNGARPIQAPAQLLADAIHEIEVLRKENARLLAANKDLQLHFDVVKEDLKKANEENTRLRDLLSEGDAVLAWVLLEGIDEAIPTTCPVEYARIVDAAKAIAAAIREGGKDETL